MESLILLTALVGVDLAITDTASPRLAITEVAKPVCPCGITGCDCPAGECDCEKPHIIATVADRGCPPCVRWENEVVPELEAKDWRIQIVRVPFGSEATPSFTFQGRKLEGYSGKAAFFEWLKASLPTGTPAGVVATSQAAPVGLTSSDIPAVEPGARVTHIDGVPVEKLLPKAKPIRQERRMTKSEGFHAHVCRSCGFEWWHNGGDHNCDRCGAVTTTIARWAP